MVHGAGLRQRRADRGRRGADAQALVRAPVQRQESRPGDRARRAPQGDRAGPDLEGVLLQLRLGGERYPGQAGLVHEQRARPAAQEEDHQPHQGLSRHHHRVGLAHGLAQQSDRLRRADRKYPAYRVPASLSVRARGRDRGAILGPARGRARADDHCRGSRHGRGLHRRTGDGCGRRHSSTGRLFRGDRAGLRQV